MSFAVSTAHPVAVDSLDHKEPCGAIHDNHRNQKFNNKLYELFNFVKPLYVLDLGCAGGGMVKNFVEDGHYALGLEGSDINLRTKRAEWATIPQNLFTCDCTKPFTIHQGPPVFREPRHVRFDVITAWEFMEHIAKPDLPQLFDNVRRHLKKSGGWFMSVALFDSGGYHQTVESWEWWYNTLAENGFRVMRELCDWNHFKHDEWIRCDEPLERRAQIVVKLK